MDVEYWETFYKNPTRGTVTVLGGEFLRPITQTDSYSDCKSFVILSVVWVKGDSSKEEIGLMSSANKKAGDSLAVSTRKVSQHRSINIGETVGEHEVEGIIFPFGVSAMLRPSSSLGFTNKVKELGGVTLGGPADLTRMKVSCHRFCLSMDGCNTLESPDELRQLKVI